MGRSMAFVVQKKLIPFKNPRNRGGSPRGVRDPPIFATRNMKNIIMCTLLALHLFALSSGLIRSIAAPVVPIHEANSVPIDNKIRLRIGVPTRFPFRHIPPETVKRASNKRINGIYSNVRV